MARRRTQTRSGSEIVVVNAGGSRGGPMQRRRSSGGGSSKKRGRRRRGGSSVGGSAAAIGSRIQRVALGGLAYGLLIKNFPQLPRLPGIGRSGTVALAGWFLKPKNQLFQDICIAAAAIAGASFGETGTVSGDGEEVLASEG